MKRLLVYLKPYKLKAALGPLCKFAEALIELFIPIVMARLIDNGIKNADISLIIWLSVAMLLMAVVGFLVSLLGQYFAVSASVGFGQSLRNSLFKHINSFSYKEIDRFGAATLSTRVIADVNQLQTMVMMVLRLVLRAPFLCVGSMVGAAIVDFRLSIVIIVTIPVFAIILYFIIMRSIKAYGKVQKKLDNISLIASENISGARTIRAFARTEEEIKRFESANAQHAQEGIKVGRLASLSNPLTVLLVNLATLVILWLGGVQINIGNLSQGEIIIFLNYMSQILLALAVFVNLMVMITRAIASAQRVNEILAVVPSIPKEQNDTTNREIEGNITLKDVFFSYGAQKPALSNININIPKGSTVGIAGLTGSGKTTLINVIARLYDVYQGEVLIDGRDIKGYEITHLRRAISIVPQKAHLFSGTIRENLSMGRDIPDSDLLEALDAAQAGFVRTLPLGLDTFVEREGANFSGGQRARLTIARALAQKPKILILDDSSSALDYATEARLRHSLKQFSKEMTVINISQRAASIREADIIFVLDKGQVAAQGTHSELINNNELYRTIFKSQEAGGKA